MGDTYTTPRGETRQIISPSRDIFRPIMYADAFIPSYVNGYSLAVEYIYSWFLSKFPKNFFKTVHIEGKNAIEDFRKFEVGDLVKRENPAVAFKSNIQFDFNDNYLDISMVGIDRYIKRTNHNNSFFKDPQHKIYLGQDLEKMQVTFNIKTRYDTRSQQIDAYNRMRKVFRIGCTETNDIDADIHLPYGIMSSVAKMAGYAVNEDGVIIDPWNFLTYCNQHSQLPIMYKLRYINGKHEFFVRMFNLPVHMDLQDPLDADDGESSGHVMSNYSVDMQVTLLFPVPRLFLLYNESYYKNTIEVQSDSIISLYSIKILEVPEQNLKGWPMYGYSGYVKEPGQHYIETINISELFLGRVDSKIGISLNDMIDEAIKTYVSPSSFIEIKVFPKFGAPGDLNNDALDISIDWEKKQIIMPPKSHDNYYYIAVYIDRKYVNDRLISLTNANDTRFIISNNRIMEKEETTRELYTEDHIIEGEDK